jgi:transposase
VFRRAQAVRDVVKGQRLPTASDTLPFPYATLRKWVHRFASQGVQGLADRPRPGRPPKVICALAHYLDHLVDQDPLQHGSSHSQWSCQELATVLARQTGVQLSRESVREVLKNLGWQQQLEKVCLQCREIGSGIPAKAPTLRTLVAAGFQSVA